MNTYYTYNSQSDLESLYPQTYKELYPLVAESAGEFLKKGITLTAGMLKSLVDDIIKQAGMWDEDGDEEAIYASYHARDCRNHFPRRHHNRNSLRDLLRILYLRELFNRRPY